MNELGLLRQQLAVERARVSAVARACITAFGSADGPVPAGSAATNWLHACVAYLACVIPRFEERDQRLADLLRAELTPDDPQRHALETALGHGGSHETLGRLEAACKASSGGAQQATQAKRWRAFADSFEAWGARRSALDALLDSISRVSVWRTVASVDADSILEERRRYMCVAEQLPAGIRLAPLPRTAP